MISTAGLLIVSWLSVELWLVPKAARRLQQELAVRGFHIAYRDPDLRLFRGSLSLKDITLFRRADQSEPLMFLSDFALKVDMTELLWEHALWGEGEVRGGKMIIFGDAEDTVFTELGAKLDVDLERLRIVDISCTSSFGYQLTLSGEVRWGGAPTTSNSAVADADLTPTDSGNEPDPTTERQPDSPQAEESPKAYPEFPGDFAWVETIAQIFRCQADGGVAPKADLELHWDETRARRNRPDGSPVPNHQLLVSGTIRGRDIVWRNLPIDALESSFQLEDWRVAIPSIQMSGLGGTVTASSGTYHLDANQLVVEELNSTVDPLEVMRRLKVDGAGALSAFGYDSPPALTGARLLFDFDNLASSELALAVDAPTGVHYRDADGELIEFDRLSGSFGYSGRPGLHFNNVEAQINGLKIMAQAMLKGRRPGGEPAPDATETPPPGAAKVTGPSEVGDTNDPTLEGETTKTSPALAKTINRLLRVQSQQGREPVLELDIDFDANRPTAGGSALVLSASFSGSKFAWHGREVDSARLDFAFADGRLEFSDLQFVGLGGRLAASGDYHFDRKELRIPTLASTVDLATLRRDLEFDLPALLEAVDFPAPPEVHIDDFELRLGEEIGGRGKVSLSAAQGLTLTEGEDTLTATRFDLALGWSGPGVLSVERAAGRIGDLDFDVAGSLRWDRAQAERLSTPDRVDASRSPPKDPGDNPADLPPTPPAPPAPPAAAPDVPKTPDAEASFIAVLQDYLTVEAAADPLQISGQFSWVGFGSNDARTDWLEQLSFDAEIAGENYSWRGFSVRRSHGNIALRDATLHFDPLQLETTEGAIDSRATYVIVAERLHMATLRLTIDPVVVIDRLGIPLEGTSGRIEFLSSPVITGSDVLLDFSNPLASAGVLELRKADGIALLTSSDRKAILSDVRGRLRLRDGHVRADGITADFLEGEARIDLDLVPRADPLTYEVEISVNDISTDAAKEWLDPSNTAFEGGVFDLSFEGRGTGAQGTLTGSGRAMVDADNPSAQNFPLVEGLVGSLEGFFPVLRRDRSWQLDMPFIVSGGKIQTDSSRLTSRRVSATISGHVDWLNDEVDLLANVNLRGLVGIVTNLSRPFRSGFVQFGGRGTLSDVEWGLVRSLERPGGDEEGRRRIIRRLRSR